MGVNPAKVLSRAWDGTVYGRSPGSTASGCLRKRTGTGELNGRLPSRRFRRSDLFTLIYRVGLSFEHWGAQLYYYVWQLAAYFAARKLQRQVRFDLIHHVTLVKYWMPSFLSLLPVPFVWGPVRGRRIRTSRLLVVIRPPGKDFRGGAYPRPGDG